MSDKGPDGVCQFIIKLTLVKLSWFERRFCSVGLDTCLFTCD